MTTKNLVVLVGAAAVLGGAAWCLSSGSKPSGAKLNGKAIFPKIDPFFFLALEGFVRDIVFV